MSSLVKSIVEIINHLVLGPIPMQCVRRRERENG